MSLLRKSLIFLTILALLAFVATGCGGTKDKDQAADGQQQQQEVIKLKVADSFPTTHFLSKNAVFFMERLEELADGKIEIEYYPSEQLGKMKDLLDLCSQGATDIAYISVPFFSGKMPLNQLIVLPLWTTAAEGSNIEWDLVNEDIFKEEFLRYGVRPIFAYTTPQYDVGTTKKPVRSLEDLKGLKLKSSGGVYEMIHIEAGAVPVTVASNETYEAMQRGTIDGNFQSYPSMKGYRLDEIQNYCTYGASFGGYNVAYAINEKKWNSLPEDIQKIILQAGEETVVHSGEANDAMQKELRDEFEAAGQEIYDLSPEEKTQWKEAISAVNDQYVKSLNDQGLPGDEAYVILQELVAKYVK